MKPALAVTAILLLAASSGEEPATVPAGTELIISHANYAPGTYILKLTKHADGSVTLEPLNAQVVDLDGNTVGTQPVPDIPDDPEPEPDPPLTDERLEAVRARFGADVETFTRQLQAMRYAMMAPGNFTRLDELNGFIQGKMALAVMGHKDKWGPWTDWFVTEAIASTTIEEYRALVVKARKTLGEE